jgi:hypothetical protein
MELPIKANGIKINSTDMAKKHGKMGPSTKEAISADKKRARALSTGPTTLASKEISGTTTFTEKGPISGMTAGSSLVIGWPTKCMGMVYSLGKMVGNM